MPFRDAAEWLFYFMRMVDLEILKRDLEAVRRRSPLVHSLTNYVVMNNTANALLAVGASPVMAHAPEEVEDMVAIASVLVLNIGTLDDRWVKSMLLAGKAAKKKGIPVVLDPVGAGATPYRTAVCKQLIAECSPSIIRGNASEIMSLSGSKAQTKGVDSLDSSEVAVGIAGELAIETKAIVVVSGETDYITDGKRTETVLNGSTLMPLVTGMGCTATAVVAAFAAVNPDFLQAASHGMAVMGIAGEIAARKAAGNGSMQLYFLDTLCNLSARELEETLRSKK